MDRAINTAVSRFAGKRILWIPVLVLVAVFLATATAAAETGQLILKVTDNDKLVQDAEVSIHKPSGESFYIQARTNKAGIVTFVVPAGSYKFCIDQYGDRVWSHVVHTLPSEETEVKLALEQLAADKTLDPHPMRFDGTPPAKEPVMLASLTGLPGILTQSTVAAVSKDKLCWFVNDHLGTPMMIVDENQKVVWEGTHSPFGNTAITVNTIENNFRFPGQYFDAESSLNYNFHRYYDYSLGRYLRADPIGIDGGLTIYAYSDQNPINSIDPLGLDSFPFEDFVPPIALSGSWDPNSAKVVKQQYTIQIPYFLQNKAHHKAVGAAAVFGLETWIKSKNPMVGAGLGTGALFVECISCHTALVLIFHGKEKNKTCREEKMRRVKRTKKSEYRETEFK